MDEFNNNINPEENKAPENQGYTVTPEGGYYNRTAENIIQDEVTPPYTPPQQSQEQYRPTGNYGQYYQRPVKPCRKKNNKTYSAAVVVIAAVLAAVIGAVSGIAAVKLGSNDTPTTSTPKASNISINVDENVESIAQAVAQKATSSVVGIRTTTSVMNFFGGSSESVGSGSGVVYTSDGYIITNYHVIENAAESGMIEVFVDNKDTEPYEATVVGYNISTDLAVLKIDATGLSPIDIGTSKELKVGQYVVTIGSPGGIEFMGSVTYGIISGLEREVSSSNSVPLIQTDAAINPGNSGGALLDAEGKLIGINSAKIVAEEYEGMGFAIPVDTVVQKCENIITKQNQPEPYTGITISERYTAEVLSYYGFPSGAVVLSVDEGSPASEAGITRGDIITKFNGVDITDYELMSELVRECDPDTTVAITIYRSGRTYDLEIKIEANS